MRENWQADQPSYHSDSFHCLSMSDAIENTVYKCLHFSHLAHFTLLSTRAGACVNRARVRVNSDCQAVHGSHRLLSLPAVYAGSSFSTSAVLHNRLVACFIPFLF